MRVNRRRNQTNTITYRSIDRSRSDPSEVCRICYSTGDLRSLIAPCDCSGTMGILHQDCLERWLEISNTTKCEICQHEFDVVRYPKSLIYVSLIKVTNVRTTHGTCLVSHPSVALIGHSLSNQRYCPIRLPHGDHQLVNPTMRRRFLLGLSLGSSSFAYRKCGSRRHSTMAPRSPCFSVLFYSSMSFGVG